MVAKRYLNISRQLRRMESTSRSTIFSGFGELLEGIVTIRAFSAEHRFMEEFHKKNDVAIKVRLHIYEGSYDTDACFTDVLQFLDGQPMASPQF